jgi:diacylglycerol kinase (ATP)
MTPPKPPVYHNVQKERRGLNRLIHAAGYSWAGLKAGWREAFVMLPLSFWVGQTWVEVALLAGSVLLVMMVELLNTAVESVVDRVGTEWHDLSKRAKDMGSAAVLLAMVLCGGIWAAAIWQIARHTS